MDLNYEQLKEQNKKLREELEALKTQLESNASDNDYYKDRFNRINEHVNDVVYRLRLSDRKYEYISPQVEILLGYTQEDFNNNPFLIRHIIHPDYLGKYLREWRNLFFGELSDLIEMKVIHKDGTIKWVMQKNLAVYDVSGNLIAIEGLLTDITERKNTERALIESEAQKKAMLNNIPHLAWMKDCNGVYLTVNKPFADRYKRDIDEVIGCTDFDIYSEEEALQYRDSDLQVIINKRKFIFEEESNGNFWETIKAPIYNEKGKVIGVTGLALNVTEHKKKEEEIKDFSEKLAVQNVKLKLINDELTQAKEKAEKADRLKSSFLANMSHEIRTPMNAILGFATLMRDRKLSEEKQKEFINLINTNSRQLLRIISDIIDISKIESDQITVFKKNFSINKVLHVLKLNFENEIKSARKNIEIETATALPDEQAEIFTDKVRLEQILSNLLSNAVKFTDEGTIIIGYSIYKERGKIEIFVKDSGIGMTDSEQKVIFDRFRQVSSSYNKMYGGTGLGLSISKGLAARLEGTIEVESVVNQGSTFKIILPYKEGKKTKPAKIAYNAKYNWQDKTILIAEDEVANYTLLESILFPTKAKIIWAKTGVDAVNECRDNKQINLVLMDIKMPDMNGLEATKKIKKENKEIPIIAQTAFAMPQDEDNCLRAGCSDYLSKPLKVEEILEKVGKYINVYQYSSESQKSGKVTS